MRTTFSLDGSNAAQEDCNCWHNQDGYSHQHAPGEVGTVFHRKIIDDQSRHVIVEALRISYRGS
jgi:hypothetical protein